MCVYVHMCVCVYVYVPDVLWSTEESIVHSAMLCGRIFFARPEKIHGGVRVLNYPCHAE